MCQGTIKHFQGIYNCPSHLAGASTFHWVVGAQHRRRLALVAPSASMRLGAKTLRRLSPGDEVTSTVVLAIGVKARLCTVV